MKKIWLFSKTNDLVWLFLPVWVTWAICFLVPSTFHQQSLPFWFWILIIVGIDVSHVWSTLFRTYLDPEEFKAHNKILIKAPILAFMICFGVAFWSTALFWTILAYLALFHFIKQQYGFLMLYLGRYGIEVKNRFLKHSYVLYFTMLYPVVYWHLASGLEFNWFVEGDFLLLPQVLSNYNLVEAWVQKSVPFFNMLYFSFLLAWSIETTYNCYQKKQPFPTGLFLWTLTTAGNWFLGIVYFNSDFAFSLTNVVAHGIPYMLLIFVYVQRKKEIKGVLLPPIKSLILVVSMVLTILLLALGEEYFWDMWFYRENGQFFESWVAYPLSALENPIVQALGMALLSLPQITHYILDGYIWKNNSKNPYLKPILLQ